MSPSRPTKKLRNPEISATILGDLFDSLEREARASSLGALRYADYFVATLFKDCNKIFDSLRNSEGRERHSPEREQYLRRAYARSLASFAEGCCAAMRQVALWRHERGDAVLDHAELGVLRQEAYSWKDGALTVQPAFLDLVPNVDSSLTLLLKAHRASLPADPVDDRGLALLDACEVFRHRVTHPESEIDMQIGERQVITINSALFWLKVRVATVVTACRNELDTAAGKQLLQLYSHCLDGVPAFDLPKSRVRLMHVFGQLERASRGAFFARFATRLVSDAGMALQDLADYTDAIRRDGLTSESVVELYRLGRLFLSAFLVSVNGMTSASMRLLVWAAESGEVGLDAGERFLLEEKRYRLHGATVEAYDSFNQLMTNVTLAFEVVPRRLGLKYTLNKGVDGWRRFRSATKLRHRLTHPKSPKELFLDPEWIEVVRRAFLWFREQELLLLRDLEAYFISGHASGERGEPREES